MIDLSAILPASERSALAALVRQLSCAEFLAGPGRDFEDVIIDPIFSQEAGSALADLGQDVGRPGVFSSDLPVPGDLVGPVLHQDASRTFREIRDGDGMSIGVGAFDPDGHLLGFYAGCTLFVLPGRRGGGTGSDLVALRFALDRGLPLWDHDKPGFSPLGEAAHMRGFEKIQNAIG